MTSGLVTVARLEMRQRLRSTRWWVALGVWCAVVALVTIGVSVTLGDPEVGDSSGLSAGPTIFGLVTLFVLFLGLLVAPTLSATSINGDRSNGTLAVLQATTLSPWDIALGKLAASWGAALAFLAVSLPFLLWGLVDGGTSPWRALAAVLTLAFLLLVVCAVGLAMSALVGRTSGSAVLTYVVVAALSVGTLIAFGLSAVLLTSREQVEVYGVDWSDPNASQECTTRVEERDVWHSEYTAWLLALNPFVIVSDVGGDPTDEVRDPMSAISYGVRWAQAGPSLQVDECWQGSASSDGTSTVDTPAPPPPGAALWPWSLAAYLVLGAGSVWFVARRLAIPAVRLPRGQRIA